MKLNSPDFSKAKSYAFRLLKIRARSEKELYNRLEKKKFSSEVAVKTVDYLKELNIINDRDLAQSWTNSKIKRGYGALSIEFDLCQKGISKEIIDECLNETPGQSKTIETIREIAKTNYDKLFKHTKDPIKAKRRIYALLLRRGFSPEDVQEVIATL